jgi:hypothetical protein
MWTRAIPGWRPVFTMNSDSFAVATLAQNEKYYEVVLVQKFDLSGNLVWSRSFPGEISSFGLWPKIAMDAGGNVVVAQTTEWPNSRAATEVVRYDASGAKTYDVSIASQTGYRPFESLASDPSGSAYVLVDQYENSQLPQLLSKYAPNGSLVWSKQFVNMLFPSMFDGLGNSYGLGLLNGVPTLVKYDGNMNVLWSKTSNVPAGTTATLASNGDIVLAGTGLTVSRFDASGNFKWSTTLAGYSAFSVRCDSVGNVFAFGGNSNPSAFTVARFDSAGNFSWAKVEPYSNIGVFDFSSAFTVNKDGISLMLYGKNNAATYGDFHGSAYSAAGNGIWSTDYDFQKPYDYAVGSCTDSTGATYVTGASLPYGSFDVQSHSLARFSTTGNVSWSRTLPLGLQEFGAVGPIPFGGGCLLGHTRLKDGTSDITAIELYRYDVNGNLVSTITIPTTTDQLSRIFAAPDGGILLLVTTPDPDPDALDPDARVIKLNSSGVVQWSTTLSGQIGWPFNVAVDSSGALYLSGTAIYPSNAQHASLAKFGAQGGIAWTRTMDDEEAYGDQGGDLDIDSSGNAFWIPLITVGGQTGTYLKKFDSAGNELWSVPSGLSGGYAHLRLDGIGNLFITGNAPDGSSSILEKLNLDGQVLWTVPGGGSLIPDGLGGVFTGEDTFSNNGRDATVTRFSPDGSRSWPQSGGVFVDGSIVHDEAGLDNETCGISLDAAGNLYLAGHAFGPSGTIDYNVIKYNARDSVFSAQSVPLTMIAGQTYAVSSTFQNTGMDSWTNATGYKLNATNASTWGITGALLSNGEIITPAQSRKFSFNIYAPTTPGTYSFQTKMYRNASSFGALSTITNVVVSAAPDASRYLTQSEPASVKAGSTFTVKVDMRNVGSNTWTRAGGYVLAPAYGYPGWNVASVPLAAADSIAKGSDKVFTFSAQAPPTPGTYSMRFQMKKGSTFFGDRTTVKTITVTP